jgi:hypothetical protein
MLSKSKNKKANSIAYIKYDDGRPIKYINLDLNNLNNIVVSDSDSDSDDDNLYNIVDESFIYKNKSNIKPHELTLLYNKLKNKNYQKDEDDLYNKSKKRLDDNKYKSITTNGNVFPLCKVELNQCERQFLSGAAGSGKSTYTNKYINEYKKCFPKNKIIIISKVNNDKAFTNNKHKIYKIEIDEEFIKDPPTGEELKNSLVIFDDIDTLQEPYLSTVLFLRDDLLETGRHHNIYMICTGHQLCNYKKTKLMLIESSSITFYPQGSKYHIKRFLKEYCGLENNIIKKVLKVPSRWCTIYKRYPQYVVHEKGVFLL